MSPVWAPFDVQHYGIRKSGQPLTPERPLTLRELGFKDWSKGSDLMSPVWAPFDVRYQLALRVFASQGFYLYTRFALRQSCEIPHSAE